ncbi:MAG: hypothetical protein ACFB8W_23485 [Elainellaceae cyanobacterium]
MSLRSISSESPVFQPGEKSIDDVYSDRPTAIAQCSPAFKTVHNGDLT